MTTDLDIARTTLTPKQLRVYELHYRGLSKRNIALALDLSPSTVQTHLENARRNIARHRRTETPA
jgi:DNA-binding NarL/FixJ family response regulator